MDASRNYQQAQYEADQSRISALLDAARQNVKPLAAAELAGEVLTPEVANWIAHKAA